MSAELEKLPLHVASELRAIASDPTKHTARFQFVCFGQEGINRLVRAFSKHKQLHELSLLNCDIGGQHGAVQLARGLPNLPSLQTFILLGANLPAEGMKAIVSELKECPALHHLTLSGNTVSVGVARTLARRVRKAKALHTLCLSDTHLGDDGLETLAAGLKENTTLKELNLNSNHLGPAAALRLADALQGHATLRVLSLYNNHFGWEDGRIFSALYSPDRPLTILWTGPARDAYTFEVNEAMANRNAESNIHHQTQEGSSQPSPGTCVETQPRKLHDPKAAAMLRTGSPPLPTASQRGAASSDGAWTVRQKASIRYMTAPETRFGSDPMPQRVHDGRDASTRGSDSRTKPQHTPRSPVAGPALASDKAAISAGEPAKAPTAEPHTGTAPSAEMRSDGTQLRDSKGWRKDTPGASSHLQPTSGSLEEQLADKDRQIMLLIQELHKETTSRRSLESSLAHAHEGARKTRAATADQQADSTRELKQRLQDMDTAFAQQCSELEEARAEASRATYELEQARIDVAKYESLWEDLRADNDKLTNKYNQLNKVVEHVQAENQDLKTELQAARAQIRGRKFGQLEEQQRHLQTTLKQREQELARANRIIKGLREEVERKPRLHHTHDMSARSRDRGGEKRRQEQNERQRDLERLLNLRLAQEETLTTLRPIRMRGSFSSSVFLTSFKGTQVRACQIRVPPALTLLKLPQHQEMESHEGRVASVLLNLLRLRHPNIACFMGLVEAAAMQATGFILTAWEDSGTLFDFLHHRHDQAAAGEGKHVDAPHQESAAPRTDTDPDAQLPLVTRYQILLDICRAMRYVNGQGVFHRRLNSMNVLLTATLTAKVTGFAESAIGFDNDPRTEAACWWASPEQLLENLVSYDTDVFSFGCIMWEVALLSVPWHLPQTHTPGMAQGSRYMGQPPSLHRVKEAYQEKQHLPLDVSFGSGREIDRQHLRDAIAGCFQPSGYRASWYALASALHALLHISPPPPDAGEAEVGDRRAGQERCVRCSGEFSDDGAGDDDDEDARKGYVEIKGVLEDAGAMATYGKPKDGELVAAARSANVSERGDPAQAETAQQRSQPTLATERADAGHRHDEVGAWDSATCAGGEVEGDEVEGDDDDQGERTVYGETPVDEDEAERRWTAKQQRQQCRNSLSDEE